MTASNASLESLDDGFERPGVREKQEPTRTLLPRLAPNAHRRFDSPAKDALGIVSRRRQKLARDR